MSTPPSVFKANDIRGIYPDALDETLAYRIGYALAAHARPYTAQVAVGQDCRLSSPALAAALMHGLTDAGIGVYNIGTVPTPALYYAAVQHGGGCGVMITGSHNPKNYNGAKIMVDGKTLKQAQLAELQKQVIALPAKDVPPPAVPAPPATDIRDAYINAVVQAHPQPSNRDNAKTRALKIVVDAGNGAAGHYAPALYEAMGHTVIPLFCELDGNFPNHHPDPAQIKNLDWAKDAVAQHNADCAFVFDGDGDRLGLVLPHSPDIFADFMLMVFARDLLARHSGARVVFDVKCSAHLAPWVAQHGGIPDMQPTGHAFIKARMQATGALLGGEMSGHFYFKDNWFGFDDALFAGARIANILSATPDAFASLPQSIASPELQVAMEDGQSQHKFIAQLCKTASFPAQAKLISIDGIRLEYADGFGLVRASNTTPALVLRFEGQDQPALDRITTDFRTFLTAAGLPPHRLPF